MEQVEFILYVADQERSKRYYSNVLGLEPDLNVPGMTEFLLSENVKLGLMPEEGIAKILTGHAPHPAEASGIPRCELYLRVADVNDCCERAISEGGKMVSSVQARDWGDTVGYIADPDGHILAFARKTEKKTTQG